MDHGKNRKKTWVFIALIGAYVIDDPFLMTHVKHLVLISSAYVIDSSLLTNHGKHLVVGASTIISLVFEDNEVCGKGAWAPVIASRSTMKYPYKNCN